MELQKLPISLIMVVRNSNGRLKDVIESHRDIVSEVIVVDQSSTDGTFEEAQKYADIVVKRTAKGKCEPDRNFAFELGSQPWVLNLDDDEALSQPSKERLAEVLEYGADIVWLKRDNFINGISMVDKLGADPQCRLFKRGSVRWYDETHTYPDKADHAAVYYSDLWIIHRRTFDQIIRAHTKRAPTLEPNALRAEDEYIGSIATELRKRGVL